MPAGAFVTLPPSIWVLDASIRADRRKSLLNPTSFEDIVASLCEFVSVKAVKSKQMDCWKGTLPIPERITVQLEVRDEKQKHWVDLFHNSAAGVRAQCLSDVELGGAAFDYARDRLRERARVLLPDHRMRATLRAFTARSLDLESTKVWIHQGLWVRHASMADRHLRIAQWEANEAGADAKARTLLRYGSKAPTDPSAIDLIGGWLHPSGKRIGKAPGDRPLQVKRYGFT